MTLHKFSIKTRLAAGFAVVLLLGTGLAGLATANLLRLQDLNADLYRHPFLVSTQALQLKAAVLGMRYGLEDVVSAPDAAALESEVAKIAQLEAAAVARLGGVRERYLGLPRDLEGLDAALAEWRQLRLSVIDLKRQGRQAAAAALQSGKGEQLAGGVEGQIDQIIEFAMHKAEEFHGQAEQARAHTLRLMVWLTAALLLVGGGLGVVLTRSIIDQLHALRVAMSSLAEGNLEVTIPERLSAGEIGAMAGVVDIFKDLSRRLKGQHWIKSNIAQLSTAMHGAETTRELAQGVIERLVPLVDAGVGVFHIWRPEAERLELLGSYGFQAQQHVGSSCRLGEGLVGQCGQDKTPILITDLPADYIRIASGIGDAPPRMILLAPVLAKDNLLGVVEIATFKRFTELQQAFVDELLPIVGLNLEILDRNRRTRVLLEETRQQAEELRHSEEQLRAQSDALQAANEELRETSDELQQQSEELRASEEELRAQREELQATNEELSEKTVALEQRGAALELAREESEKRALELSVASRYKSEFLANMSHELRTPLNSLLILAKYLADNEEGNLTLDQAESAKIVHESGHHLLQLINDILDLSKVEAGKMEVVPEDILLGDFAVNIQRRFARLAEARSLFLRVEAEADLPPLLRCDRGKLDQIVNNLVANAVKFTRQGGVTVRFSRQHRSTTALPARDDGYLAIAVHDTGVGVPAEKLDRIFQAFEQADGSTSRTFGGTGLGLTISQRLAQLMEGDIDVTSVEGEGSTFTLVLPLLLPDVPEVSSGPGEVVVPAIPSAVPAFVDDRELLLPGDEVIVVIEDDDAFARILCDLARKRGFRSVRAADGRSGLELATRYRPSGILLDVALPEMDGWAVMANLKQTAETRHIPVHFISAIDDSVRGLQMGAVGYATKPVSKEQMEVVFDRLRHFAADGVRRVLVVDDDAGARKATTRLVKSERIQVVEAGSAEQALALLKSDRFDCLVLDLVLPDLSGFDLLDRAAASGVVLPPVVVYSGKELSYEENLKLREYTDSIVIKGARSPERLVDEVSLFLHSVQSSGKQENHRRQAGTQDKDERLSGRSVLVVDDDMRNAFALSKILRGKGLKVLVAQDGHKALAQLAEHRHIDIVLMDIMMPGMDGYATIREVRKEPALASLPIIALTAKAMKGDREKCLEAGADDYLSKPVDVAALLERMRALLCHADEPA